MNIVLIVILFFISMLFITSKGQLELFSTNERVKGLNI